MSGCMLVVVGRAFDPDSLLSGSTVQAYRVFRRGEPRFPGVSALNETSGFTVSISDTEVLSGQIEEATAYLKEHAAFLRALATATGVEDKHLDFGHTSRLGSGTASVQVDVLPASLLRLANEAGLDVRLSLYPTDDH